MSVNVVSNMKKIIVLAIALSVSSAWADVYREYRYVPRVVQVERHAQADILVPLIIGGMVGAAIANQNQPQPVPQGALGTGRLCRHPLCQPGRR